MADGIVKMDASRAYEWSSRVNAEIARTNQTLKEVADVCNEFPGEGDVIMQSIQVTGNLLQTAYEATSNAFKNAWEEISRGISEFSKVGEKITDTFEDFKSKIAR